MELKSAETEVDDLRQLYERVLQHLSTTTNNSHQQHAQEQQAGQRWLPQLRKDDEESTKQQHSASSTHIPTATNSDSAPLQEGVSGKNNAAPLPLPFPNARAAASALDALHQRLEALEPRINALNQRRHVKDPVTGNPRYGANTLGRIDNLLKRFQEMVDGVAYAVGEEDHHDPEVCSSTTTTEFAAQSLRKQAAAEEEAERLAVEQEEERLARDEERRKAEEALRLEHERQQREEAAREADRARLELARQAQEARLAQQRARDEADRADREWERSIGKGIDAVREQLAMLVHATSNDLTAQKCAIEALHTIFSQIVARPEEPNFRRIRRDHPKFNADIGRHPGGKELLLAAGFVLGRIDEVPSYVSKEPNLETDMDGWASWYDLLKASLEAIEEQLILTA